MIRYIFLSFRQRLHSDQKTFGSLFHACCDEVKDLTLVEAMHSLMSFVIEKIRSTGEFAEDLMRALIDTMMGAAIEFLETSCLRHRSNNLISIN